MPQSLDVSPALIDTPLAAYLFADSSRMEKTCKVTREGTPILTALIRLSKMPLYCLWEV